MPILRLNLNARFQPMHRHEFEDALGDAMSEAGLGEVVGGGTLQADSGEVENCDVEIEVENYSDDLVNAIHGIVGAMGVPVGSRLILEEESREIAVGNQEGLAVYMNGTDLPDEVYRDCDINFVYSEFDRLLEEAEAGGVYSHWQGPTETALYLYGKSADEMHGLIKEFMAGYPLCEKARVEKIA